MILQTIIFYLFASVTVAAAVTVIGARNPVHSVLFLILAFFNAAGLFILLGAEFLAMILVVVYVGAVAVLFLFVVMMLNINVDELKRGFLRYAPIGLVVGGILLVELILILGGWAIAPEIAADATKQAPPPETMTNTHALGQLIYTDYIFLFQAAGIILLVAMIGAIVLTLRHREGVRRQNIADQVARRPEDTVELKKVTPGGGI